MPRRLRAFLLLPLLSVACVTERTTTTTWSGQGPYAAPPERYGRVEWIRENVTRTEGNVGAGAAAGAVIGGLLGYGIVGRPGGALFGAAGGAAVGAAASQGGGERRSYDVAIRFDDGAFGVYRFANGAPFAVGDRIAWYNGRFWRTSPPPGAPPASAPTAPPAYQPPPPGAPPPPPQTPPAP